MTKHIHCTVCGYSVLLRDGEELEELECPQCGWDLTDDLDNSRNDS